MGIDSWITAATGGSGISINNTGTKDYKNTAVTTYDYLNVTVSPGSNIVLLLTLNFDNSGTPITNLAATWDVAGANQAMTTLVFQQDSTGNAAPSSAILGLKNPTPGTNKTITITWTTASRVFACSMAFNGVDQTTPFPHTAGGTLSATVNLTTTSGNYALACEAAGASQGTQTGTLIYDDHAAGSFINAMANYDIASGTSLTIGNSSIANSCIVAVDIKAA